EASNTIGALIAEYLELCRAKWRPRTYINSRRYLADFARPLHRLPVTKLTQRDVASLLNRIAAAHGDVSANRARDTIHAFLRWVLQQGIRLPEGNVAAFTAKRKEATRERVLTEDELRRIWRAAGDDDFGAALKLLILTGQREMEIGDPALG